MSPKEGWVGVKKMRPEHKKIKKKSRLLKGGKWAVAKERRKWQRWRKQ